MVSMFPDYRGICRSHQSRPPVARTGGTQMAPIKIIGKPGGGLPRSLENLENRTSLRYVLIVPNMSELQIRTYADIVGRQCCLEILEGGVAATALFELRRSSFAVFLYPLLLIAH